MATNPRYHLHDAMIRELRVDRDGRTFDMRLRVVGGIKVRLRFDDADLVGEHLQSLAFALGAQYMSLHGTATYTEVIAQEVELASLGRFLLRLRLSPFHEFAIEFGSMTLRVVRGKDEGEARPARLVLARPSRSSGQQWRAQDVRRSRPRERAYGVQRRSRRLLEVTVIAFGDLGLVHGIRRTARRVGP